MKTILLQMIVFICAAAAIFGIKGMDFPAWITYPLVALAVVLTLFGLAVANYERKSALEETYRYCLNQRHYATL